MSSEKHVKLPQPHELSEREKEDAMCTYLMMFAGGKIVFYTVILPIAKNADGIAAIMGHEVAHALLDHGGQRMSMSMAQQVGNIVAIKATEKQPEKKRSAILMAYGIGSSVGAVLPFSRKHESEADKIGLELMAIAGYDVTEAPKLWERMKAASGRKSQPELLSTHPSNQRRIDELKRWIPDAKTLAIKVNAKRQSDLFMIVILVRSFMISVGTVIRNFTSNFRMSDFPTRISCFLSEIK